MKFQVKRVLALAVFSAISFSGVYAAATAVEEPLLKNNELNPIFVRKVRKELAAAMNNSGGGMFGFLKSFNCSEVTELKDMAAASDKLAGLMKCNEKDNYKFDDKSKKWEKAESGGNTRGNLLGDVEKAANDTFTKAYALIAKEASFNENKAAGWMSEERSMLGTVGFLAAWAVVVHFAFDKVVKGWMIQGKGLNTDIIQYLKDYTTGEVINFAKVSDDTDDNLVGDDADAEEQI